VILLGHALRGGLENIENGKDIAFNIDSLGTIVKTLNTQEISRDMYMWHSSDGPRLEHLVAKLNFTHTNPYTACNDAARTLMSAIYLAIPSFTHQNCKRSMQVVADAVELHSVANFRAFGPGTENGVETYCWKCTSTSHSTGNCTATGLACTECLSRGLFADATAHIAIHCPVVAQEESEERREWFKGQPKPAYGAKVPFSSRLKTYRPGGQVFVPSAEEVDSRRAFYDVQPPNAARRYWVYWRRSFRSYQFVKSQGGVW